MNAFEKLAEALLPETATISGAIGRVVSASPPSVSVMGLTFTGAQLGVNAKLTGEEAPAVGATVLCVTLDGWQTILLLCEVT